MRQRYDIPGINVCASVYFGRACGKQILDFRGFSSIVLEVFLRRICAGAMHCLQADLRCRLHGTMPHKHVTPYWHDGLFQHE